MASRLASPLAVPDEDDIDLFDIMAALADPLRRSIVQSIAIEPGRACSGADYGVSKSALTRHWRVLREAGLIRQEAHGTRHLNWIRRDELDRRFPGLMDVVLAEAAREPSPTPSSDDGLAPMDSSTPA